MESVERRQPGESGDDLLKDFLKRGKLNKESSKIRRYFFLRKYYGKNKQLLNYFSNQQAGGMLRDISESFSIHFYNCFTKRMEWSKRNPSFCRRST